jgi:hypothetical protein
MPGKVVLGLISESLNLPSGADGTIGVFSIDFI